MPFLQQTKATSHCVIPKNVRRSYTSLLGPNFSIGFFLLQEDQWIFLGESQLT
jgi:hypothetical protein